MAESSESTMSMQQQWQELCAAYEKNDWEALEQLLPQVWERLNARETPIISDVGGHGLNLAMARAGVEYIRGHFTRTQEWPTLTPDNPSEDTFAE